MKWMLMPGDIVYSEIPLGFLYLAAAVVIAIPVVMFVVATMIAAATYRMGERVAPQEQRYLVGMKDGQCAAKDQTNAQLLNLVARQAEQIGAARGAGKHLRAVGL